jgi:4-hydroxybenzoate polyprenyltransferase
MKRFLHTLKKGITALETMPTSYTLWLTSFMSLIFVRIAVENWLGDFGKQSLQFLFYEYAHTFFFFLFSFLMLWPVVAFFGKTSLSKASTVLLFGLIVIVTPPLLDVWIANGAHLWSFYKFDSLFGLWHRYLTLFGDRPDIGITYGVRIEIVLGTVFLSAYTYLKTNHVFRALFAGLTVYSIFFLLGTFPSWLTFIILGFQKSILTINDLDIVQLFLSPLTLFTQSKFELGNNLNVKMSLIYAPLSLCLFTAYLWRYFPKKFFTLLHNARIPQIIYHGGLFFVGLGLALALTHATLPLTLFNVIGLVDLIIAIELAWLASVVVNDLFDQKIDSITNTHRPLQQKVFSIEEYKAIGITFFIASLIFSALVSFKIMPLLLVYQALAWAYSAWPLRLKRFPIIATFSAAVASVIILITGFILIAPDGSIANLPGLFVFFFLCILTVFLTVKDFRDIDGDKANSAYTVPVLFGEYRSKTIIGSGIFLSYMMSVSVFHEQKLFWWALLFGSVSFWVLMISLANEKKLFSYRKLSGWMLGIAALYSLILIKIISF